MRAGSWMHAAAAPPHQAFTSDPAGVVSDAVRFCPFATGNDILYAKACTSRRAMPSHDPATLVWRPDGCAVTGFDARAFVSLLQGRTLVFSGDSLMRQLFLGTLCALHAAGAVQPATVCAGSAALVGADGMLYCGPSAGAVATSSSALAKSAMGRFGSDATLAKLRARGCARNVNRKADNTTVGDCTHWCSPGPLEAYTLPMLQAYLARLKPHSSKERGARTRG